MIALSDNQVHILRLHAQKLAPQHPDVPTSAAQVVTEVLVGIETEVADIARFLGIPAILHTMKSS